jgi:hypothetical protein
VGGITVFVMVGAVAAVLRKYIRLHPAITWSICLIVLLFVLPNVVDTLTKAYKLEPFMDPRHRAWEGRIALRLKPNVFNAIFGNAWQSR